MSTNVAEELNLNTEEVELPEKLIKEYKDLNEKIDQIIIKINNKKQRNPSLKK